ncbi:protein phosphatase 1 regulatory subunit 3B-B isoform X3 [Pogonomyrmex barbatus]|uniref:Protein phosphatase 1 regulatory subunit 3B-B isoform X3 n=1 Tax=Pogonomyrmex barbatus TaxID=144034 RepID=A0A8N1SA01_9HYME|nr:protein phosphatase 1 regulatory subunit 3B-B isoform X3 [Pogonomyrmex barbatus]
MCSIAMPAELILHSPPVYSPLLYSPLVVTAPTITSRSVPPRIRPCLSSGSLPLDSLRSDGSGKQKKRVVFADDRGRPLTQVRVMSEPSNVPPLWSTAYVAGLTGGLLGTSKDHSQEATQDSTPPWQVTFQQPASDYLAFRRKLDQENVSLENVIVRESEQCLVGTVKPRVRYDNIQTTKCDVSNGNETRDGSIPQIAEATRLNMRTWSEFASWQHLANDAPYW